MECRVEKIYVDADDRVREFSWEAHDWPAIKATAREEDWTFYRHVIVTVLAALTIGWVVISGRCK